MNFRMYAVVVSVVICLGAWFAGLSDTWAASGDGRMPVEKTLSAEAKARPHTQYAEQAGQPGQRGTGEAADPVFARVNATEITMSEVMEMMKQIEQQKNGRAASATSEDLRQKALDRLIFQELAYEKAKAMKITVSEEEIDKAIANLKTNMGGDEEYRKFLAREGFTEEKMRVQVERSLTLQKIVTKEVVEKAAVTEERLREAYDKEKDKYATPEKVVVVDVVFFLKMNDEDSIKKAEEIRRKIEADAKKDPWSLPPDSSYVVRELEVNKDKNEDLYKEAKKLSEGGLSGVFRGSDSLHILKLVQYIPERQFTFEESKASLAAKLRGNAQKKRLHEWEQELKKDAVIKILTTE